MKNKFFFHEQINKPNHHGETPLQRAVYYGFEKIVRALLKTGADATKVDREYFESALEKAASNGHRGTVALLKKQ